LPTRLVDRQAIDSNLEEYLAHIRDYFEFSEKDARLIKETGDALRENITKLMDEFYEKQLSYSTTASFFLNADGTPKPEFKKAREGITRFLLTLADGRVDISFAQRAERIGDVHTKLKLDVRYMVGATSFFQERIAELVRQRFKGIDAHEKEKAGSSWMKLLAMTLDLMLRSFVKLTYQDLIVELRSNALVAEKNRKAAELLQDILSHDIRNYNQIVMLSAELLNADLTNADTRSLVDAILKATKGSSDLTDRAKKLGRIISQAQIELYPVDVEGSLQTSVALIIKAHPERSIHLSSSVKSGAQVLADDLLEEVFTNILSNSVNYTERDEVPVEIQVEEQGEEAILDQKRRPYWKISFTDHGRGITDKMKETVFARYLSTATGAGLGLSIVHALVVERYSGKVAITDRVEGDYAKGTRVEVWLPKAP